MPPAELLHLERFLYQVMHDARRIQPGVPFDRAGLADLDIAFEDYRDVRDIAAPLRIDETTTLRWFAVDIAGNVEGGYDPNGRAHNDRRVRVRIADD